MATAGDAVRTERRQWRRRRTPNAGKQIEGGTANFIYRSARTDLGCQLHYAPQKTEGLEDGDRGRQGGRVEGSRVGGVGGVTGAALSQRQIIYFIAILRSIGIDREGG